MDPESHQVNGSGQRKRRVREATGVGVAVAAVLAAIIGATTGNWAMGIGVGAAGGASVFSAYVAVRNESIKEQRR